MLRWLRKRGLAAADQARLNRASKSLAAELVLLAKKTATGTRLALLDKDATGVSAEPVIFAELLYVSVHLAARYVTRDLGSDQGEYLLQRLIADTNSPASTFASRQAHYSKMEQIAPASGEEYRGTLLWDVASRLAGSHASNQNPARMGLVIFQIRNLPPAIEQLVAKLPIHERNQEAL